MGTKNADAAPPPLASSSPASPCTSAEHNELKADPVRFFLETDPIGPMHNRAGGGVLLVNCKRCGSTLARPLPPCAPTPILTLTRAPTPTQPMREAAEAAAKLGLTPDLLARALDVCPRCACDLVGGVCEPCARQRSGERCCQYAARFQCFCAQAWTCMYHGECHSGTHD